MQAILAHSGHEHGPDLTLVAVVVAVLVLAVIAAGSAIQRVRNRRTPVE